MVVVFDSGSLLAILFVCKITDIAYYTAMMLISSNVYLMFSLRITLLRWVAKLRVSEG